MKPHGNGNKSKVSFDKDEGGLCESDERRDVAQPGSATVWGTGGRKFKSCHPDKPNNNHLIFQVVILFLLCQPCQGGRGVIYNRCVSTCVIIRPSSYMLWVCLITNE